MSKKLFLFCCVFFHLSFHALADLEKARDLMEANQFEQAMEELIPAARSGNAEAEELIGVMYAMGLGVERDEIRAFDWYLRSAMKGHPGAQSGVGWYYEVGIGMPAPDLILSEPMPGTSFLQSGVILMQRSVRKKWSRK